jgi:phosphoadenosine phosphosulfate reductase
MGTTRADTHRPSGTAADARIAAVVTVMRRAVAEHAPVVLASSFGAEDMVLIDLLATNALPIGVLTLDTGRLPDETHALIDRVRAAYRIEVEVHFPEAAAAEPFVRANGVNAFYASLALREECCSIRKMRPLARALVGKGAWITGLRREQSPTRRDVAVEAFDAAHGLVKINPLADWTRDDVWSYVREHRVPYNALHDRGYASIGCAPCTRAIEPGEDERAGRWWWESADRKECGLHRHPGAIPIRPLNS